MARLRFALPTASLLLLLFSAGAILQNCSPGEIRSEKRPVFRDEKVVSTNAGGCFHNSRTACVEYSSSFKPEDVRRQCLNRDVETFLPAGCPEPNRLGRCVVRRDMLIFFYNKLTPEAAARVCRNSFQGRWISGG